MGRDAVGEQTRTVDPAGLERRLRDANSVQELLSVGAAAVRDQVRFDRALVASVEGGWIRSGNRPVWDADDDDDLLAHDLQLRPVEVQRGSREADALAHPGRAVALSGQPTALGDALKLEHWALVPLAADGPAVAALIVDRAEGEVTESELAALEICGVLLGAALERIALRQRLKDLSAEFRHLTASAEALMHEAVAAPVSAARASGYGTLFTETGYAVGDSDVDLAEMFSEREREIADRLCSGRSNREIAEELFIAPDTVKDHIARIAGKLNARNRVEAAASYARLQEGAASALADGRA